MTTSGLTLAIYNLLTFTTLQIQYLLFQLKLKRLKLKEKKLDQQNFVGSFITLSVALEKGVFFIINWICGSTFLPMVTLPKKCRTISGRGHLKLFPICKFLGKITGQSERGCLNISSSRVMQVSKFHTKIKVRLYNYKLFKSLFYVRYKIQYTTLG